MGRRGTSSAENPEAAEVPEDTIAILKSLSAQFAIFSTKIDTLEAKLNESLAENAKLKSELKEKTKVIHDLQTSYASLEAKLNSLEQYNRSWSVRVNNIPLTSEEERNPFLLRDKVFSLAFRPILMGAVEAGLIPTVPAAENLLEVAHPLPSKPGVHKPIIARFRDRNLRSLCLRLKKTYATKVAGQDRGAATGASTTGDRAGGGGADGGSSGGGARGGGM
jgi:chaperonin cofactor prefoldin